MTWINMTWMWQSRDDSRSSFMTQLLFTTSKYYGKTFFVEFDQFMIPNVNSQYFWGLILDQIQQVQFTSIYCILYTEWKRHQWMSNRVITSDTHPAFCCLQIKASPEESIVVSRKYWRIKAVTAWDSQVSQVPVALRCSYSMSHTSWKMN